MAQPIPPMAACTPIKKALAFPVPGVYPALPKQLRNQALAGVHGGVWATAHPCRRQLIRLCEAKVPHFGHTRSSGGGIGFSRGFRDLLDELPVNDHDFRSDSTGVAILTVSMICFLIEVGRGGWLA